MKLWLLLAGVTVYNNRLCTELKQGLMMEKLQYIGRFLAVIVGILLIMLGTHYAMLLFTQIYDGVTDPATVTKTLDQWARFIVSDLDDFEHNSSLNKVEHLRIISLIIVAVGGLILTWLTVHLIVAGAKVLEIATSLQAIGATRAVTQVRAAGPAPVRGPAANVKREPQYTPIPPRTQNGVDKSVPGGRL